MIAFKKEKKQTEAKAVLKILKWLIGMESSLNNKPGGLNIRKTSFSYVSTIFIYFFSNVLRYSLMRLKRNMTETETL